MQGSLENLEVLTQTAQFAGVTSIGPRECCELVRSCSSEIKQVYELDSKSVECSETSNIHSKIRASTSHHDSVIQLEASHHFGFSR
jgi:hypothetical protein